MPLLAKLHILNIRLTDGSQGGAPVLNARGAAAGVLLAIFGPTNDSSATLMVGLDGLRADIEQLAAGKTAAKGWLGLNIDCPAGVCAIVNVNPDTPASAAGVMVGDVVTAANGAPIRNPFALLRMVRRASPGTAFTLSVTRDGTARPDVTMTSIDIADAPRAMAPLRR
jgi:serine protease Do